MLRRLTPVLLLIGLLAPACDRGEQIAGIPKSTELGALSAEQADAFCRHVDKELSEKTSGFLQGEFKHIECFLTSMVTSIFSDGGQQQVCQSAYDECMASDTDLDADDDGTFCPDPTVFADCSVSIEDYRTCMHDTLDEAFSAFSAFADLTCADLVTPEGEQRLEEAMGVLTADDDDEPDAASCLPIRERCPSLGGPKQPQLL